MTKCNAYIDAIDTMYPDGFARESCFRCSGDMLDPPPARYRSTGGNWLERVLSATFHWFDKRNGRLVLRELTDSQLEDIGLTRSEADREVSKSFFWD